MLAALRDASWLTADRARAWARTLGAMTVLTLLTWLVLSHGGVDMQGKPLGTDFINMYAAGRAALDGAPGDAYHPATHFALERAILPSARPDYYAFIYPPIFLLACLPLAFLPYLLALAVWLAATLAAWFACVRTLLPQRWAILPILAFPGVITNAGHGQNGYLTGACFGGFMVFLETRPFLAGLCLGSLAYKPQMLIAAPIALLAACRWRAIAGGIVSAVTLTALSYLLIGKAAWLSFLAEAPGARAALEQGQLDFSKIQSSFAAIRVLHGTIGQAYAVQAAVTLVVLAILAGSALRRPGAAAETALLVTATMLSTPYVLDYDLVCIALPIAWVTARAQKTGWLAWEKIVLLAVYLLPLLSRFLAEWIYLPTAPFVLFALLVAVLRRVREAAPEERQSRLF